MHLRKETIFFFGIDKYKKIGITWISSKIPDLFDVFDANHPAFVFNLVATLVFQELLVLGFLDMISVTSILEA